MKLQDLVNDLRNKQPSLYCVCTHPAHPSIAEILAEDELTKCEEHEGGYVRLATFETKDLALEALQKILLDCYLEDNTMQNAKEYIATHLSD